MALKPKPGETWNEIVELTQEQTQQWDDMGLEEQVTKKACEELLEAMIQKATASAQALLRKRREWWFNLAKEHNLDLKSNQYHLIPQENGPIKVVLITKEEPAPENGEAEAGEQPSDEHKGEAA